MCGKSPLLYSEITSAVFGDHLCCIWRSPLLYLEIIFFVLGGYQSYMSRRCTNTPNGAQSL